MRISRVIATLLPDLATTSWLGAMSCNSAPPRPQRAIHALHLADIRTADDWFTAMRAYPYGIPSGARTNALRAAERLEAGPARSGNLGTTQQALEVSKTTWFPIGPTPVSNGPTYGSTNVPSAGRATVIAANPANPAEVWLGTATGGLWHTYNAQTTDPQWLPFDRFQFPDGISGPGGSVLTAGAMTMSIGAIVPDGCDAQGCARIWVGTGENGIRRDTWYGSGLFLLTPVPIPAAPLKPSAQTLPAMQIQQIADFGYGTVTALALPPHAAGTTTDTAYAAVSSGVTAPGTEASTPAPDPPEGYGIYKSSGPSLTFTKLDIQGTSGSLPTDIQIDQKGQTVLVGFMAKDRYNTSEARGIFRSKDDGGSWCSINDNSQAGATQCTDTAGTSGLPPGNSVVQNPAVSGSDEVLGRITLRLSPNKTGRVYALVGRCGQHADFGCPNDTVYRSNDNGNSWTKLALSTTGNTYARYTHAFAVPPAASPAQERILLGGTEILSCPGSGGTCDYYGNVVNQTHPDHHDIVFPSAGDSQLVYDADDGGFFWSQDSGQSWTPGNSMLTTSQLDSIAAYGPVTVAGLQDQGMGVFTGSRVWGDHQVGDGGSVVVYAYGDPPQAVWIYSGQQSTPLRTVGDPLSYANTTDLGVMMPTSASDQANNENTPGPYKPAQCAFFPPIALDPNHNIYFATTQIYRSTDTDDVRGDSWATISPVLATPHTDGNLFDAGVIDPIDTDNVITAVAAAADGTVYAGTYIGEIWMSQSPCDTLSCWTKVAGPGTGKPVPHRPISSLLIDPKNSSEVYATLSGFGIKNHVWAGAGYGGSWAPFSYGLVDAPANVIRFDADGKLWLGTDIGVYRYNGNAWERSSTLPYVPVVDLAAWSDSSGADRLYAATHGRGAWVLTQPTVATAEGFANPKPGQTPVTIWDVPVYGYGFVNTTGSDVTCKISLLQQSGNVCKARSGNHQEAADTVDVTGGTIEVDTNGQLQTSNGGHWDKKPVAWACNKGKCLNGVPIVDCNVDDNGNPDLLSAVLVDCGSAGTGIGHILNAPVLANPPSGSLGFDPPASGGAAPKALTAQSSTWSFVATVTAGTGTGATFLCSAPVTVDRTATPEQMVEATAVALNASPSCQAAGVTATAKVQVQSSGEDPGLVPPRVSVQAPGLTAMQVYTSFRSAPDAATGLCFIVSDLGNPVLHQSAIMKTAIQTASSGAAGGSIRFIEDSNLGSCSRDVPTKAGMTANDIAQALEKSFNSVTSPGPVSCLARNDALDVQARGSSVFTIIGHTLTVCSFDPGVGFAISPAPLSIPNQPPDCGSVTVSPDQLWPPDHKLATVTLSSATDPDGPPVTPVVTSVYQDEPTGNSPDATLVSGLLSLRAERNGPGNGRIYHIDFTATDAFGASCKGEVTVCVPHDQGRGACGDGGALYPSGVP